MVYPKIETLFERDQKTRLVIPESIIFPTNNTDIWTLTEKVDGTNIRISYKLGGHGKGYITIDGRTFGSQINSQLIEYINDRLTYQMINKLFYGEQVVIYGEAYGKKINPECGYNCDLEFLVFDIFNDGAWLERSEIELASNILNLGCVPKINETVGSGIDMTRNGFKSFIPGEENVFAEGIIIKRRSLEFEEKRRVYKLKTSDFLGKKWRQIL